MDVAVVRDDAHKTTAVEVVRIIAWYGGMPSSTVPSAWRVVQGHRVGLVMQSRVRGTGDKFRLAGVTSPASRTLGLVTLPGLGSLGLPST